MIKVADRVRIKAEWCHQVKGYQVKALKYRRLVGVVRKVYARAELADVDFCQHDMPIMYRWQPPGAFVVLHKSVVGSSPFFPLRMLEKVT